MAHKDLVTVLTKYSLIKKFPPMHPLPDEELAYKPELIFGLVGPIGCNIDAAQDALDTHLTRFGYQTKLVHITKAVGQIIPQAAEVSQGRYEQKITELNNIVSLSGEKYFLAKIAVLFIGRHRLERNKETGVDPSLIADTPANGTAFVIRQLKRSQEIELLRKVYGEKFIQVSVSADEAEQLTAVQGIIGKEDPYLPQDERERKARGLIHKDKNEAQETFGQRMLDTYHSGDVFVGGSATKIHSQVGRFIDAFFGSNYISPTKDEFGAYLAKAASLRTLDLSRQVGAAIVSSDGDVITLGCNEVPKANGGNYWGEDENPQRDIERRFESNKLETNRIIHDFIHALSKHSMVQCDPEKILGTSELSQLLKASPVSDLTEFGRMTHAEMSALMDAARIGRSVKGATIYVTTFPCHNCAKHIIASGIKRIVYIEPYAKSKAIELNGDALTTYTKSSDRVILEHFHGISPARYREIFDKPRKRRDENNNIKPWHFDKPKPMVNQLISTHIMIEPGALKEFKLTLNKVSDGLSASRT